LSGSGASLGLGAVTVTAGAGDVLLNAVSGTVESVCLSNSVNSSAVDLGYELDL